ncbi:hypothetical protein I601_3567 [Nocardioides dokdonensis FR1436]|uniref:Uncharacterized protein n=1 Tax=Nocardioides dokdonensis FR1436 TaxID=1300347 RepID=A0A1A9GQU4_9ACTN|nr:hypothetical protein [Nocardioides dokdonensis]ANH39973.1 hypothetical protein I601_3567 [Nocardioides dokdonensis FR1436]
MSTLHDRLVDLAQDAPPALPDPALWDVARGYHRRRRVGTLVAVSATVLVLGLVGGLGWLRTDGDIRPAAPGTAPALPTQIWEPSPWLPGTDDEGPLGQLAALVTAERRGWTGSDLGVAGISATTGEYRFLDLPDLDDGGVGEVELAPDGRRVAYWYVGETRQTPQEDSPVVGVAVYDATTGEVERMPVGTDHGLMAGELTWADDERLAFDYGQYWTGSDGPTRRQGVGKMAGLWLWTPADGTEPQLLGATGLSDSVDASSGTGVLVLDRSSDRAVLDLDSAEPARSFLQPGSMGTSYTAIDPTGTRIAWPRGRRNPNDLHVGEVREGETVESTAVEGTERTYDAVAWIDADHVAAVRRDRGAATSGFALHAVDVRSGEQEELVRFPGWGYSDQLATHLLATPTVERPHPPNPWDPRIPATFAGLVLLFGAMLLLDWRRRVRP